MVPTQDLKSAFKLARIDAISYKSPPEIFEKVLEQEGDIDFKVPDYRTFRSYEIGFTAMHYACTSGNIGLLQSLLNRGADITVKNKEGDTALHKLIKKQKTIKKPLNNPLTDAILLEHVNSKNYSNPCDKNGLSHFHIACLSKNGTAVQFFLENGISVDEAVNADSEFSPGFTPLHLAAISTNTIVAQILLEHGANMHITNGRGMTSLHVLIERRIEMFDSIGDALCGKDRNSYNELRRQIIQNEKIISILMENMSSDNDSLDSIGLSNFHVACMLQDMSAARNLVDRVTDLDHHVNEDSRLWPGYSALHFAAHNSIKNVIILIKQGANLVAKDSKGLTPLDICTQRYMIETICGIISLVPQFKNLLFSDGKTKLLSLIQALADRDQFKNFIMSSVENVNTYIPPESLLWPGYSILHFVVLFSERSKLMFSQDRKATLQTDLQIIRFCCNKNADLSIQGTRGQTALHLAYRLNKMTVVDALLRHSKKIPNILDEENLSHIHIACAAKQKNKLKKCAMDASAANAVYKGTSSINKVRPGSTPLHVCLVDPDNKDDLQDKIRILLKAGADPYIKDACGLTVIHRILEYCSGYEYTFPTKKLLQKVSNDCVVEEYGLSHLHVACKMENKPAVKRLIKNGANVNLAIKYTKRSNDDPLSFLAQYDKCAPVHMSFMSIEELPKLLAKHGADMFVEKADGTTALNTPALHDFLSKVRTSVDLQKRMRREYGWTRLHLVCHAVEVDGFEDIVKAELADVNAQVLANSPVWKGWSPLHILTYRSQRYYNLESRAKTMAKILLENGADVTLIDEKGGSPIGMAFDYYVSEKICEHLTLLMKYHKDFSVNPVDFQGISHFHIACFLNNLEAIRGFLAQGVEINHPIDYFSCRFPGYTSLHLATKLEVVDLLIDRGADIHIEDARGYNVLARAIRRDIFDESVVKRIIESGADINYQNFKGETPFEIAISKRSLTMEQFLFCLQLGCVVNACNPITGVGYISIILAGYHGQPNLQIRIIERIMSESSTTVMGRTTFHHIVTGSRTDFSTSTYVGLFEKLVKEGCDVDVQDDKGKTALHLAVEYCNEMAVAALLDCGADINVLDVNRKPAICCFTHGHESFPYEISQAKSIRKMLTEYACKLAYLGLDLAKSNADTVQKLTLNLSNDGYFVNQVIACKNVKLGVRSMCLRDFLTETGAVMLYRSLSQSERCKIDEYFESIQKIDGIGEIRSFLKLQYRKAVKRIKLYSTATNSFRQLLGFDIPDLCVENVFQYLRNSDLTNIVSAEIDNEYARMDVD